MKTYKQLVTELRNIQAEAELKEGIGHTDPDYHAKVHQDLQWHASRNRGNSMGAANYHHLMTLEDPSHIENYYEKTVHPILKKHKYPTPPVGPGDGGNPKYLAAAQEIIKNWRNEPRWMHNEETELDEKRGLWDNIHAKRKRIKAGSNERMRKPGSEGAPTKQNFRDASESIDEGYDVNSKHYKALTDLDLNTKNRDMTTKHDGYGPLNPRDKKGSKAFWDDKAKMWNTTVEAAMEARCGNCAAFNQAPAIMKKMAEGLGPAGEKIQDLSNLGFCELFEFKCAGSRTCNKWLVNGPITEEDTQTSKLSEATYRGRKVTLNKRMPGDVKKSKVFVDPDGDGKAQKVNFGDKTLTIKKNNPERKKSYCARSGGQGNLNDKTSPNYWSRKAWNCEEIEIDDENTLDLTQEEMSFFAENGVQFELVEATIRNTKKLIQRLHDREQGQTYGGAPYSSHPKSVMRLGIKVFGGSRFDQNARKTALLHDTIEDTPISPETLSKRGFSPDVVRAVQLLSKDKTKSYESNIDNIARGKTAAHNYAKMVKYVDNMSNYMASPKPGWDRDRVQTQKGKYMRSMERLGQALGVDHHTKLNPKWKLKTEESDQANPSNREEGTKKLANIYRRDTPGQFRSTS